MATAIHQSGLTQSLPGGGSVSHFAPQGVPQGFSPLYQLPGQVVNMMGQQTGALAGGYGQIGSAIGGMGGQHSQALAGLGGQHAQALAGLGNAFAQNYGAYGNTIGNIANANAMDAINYYQSLGAAAAANQSGLSNMWTQALASLGGLGNALASSMGQGQVGYQQALAGMQGANQSAVSQLGQSRMNNLGRLAAADSVGNMSFDFGGGGGANSFAASGPGGQIASGSYGGGAALPGSGSAGRAAADLSPYRQDIMNNSVLSQLNDSDMEARNRLDRQQDLYRQDYSNLFGQGMLGMLTMGREGAGSMRTGMQDFYSNVGQNRPTFGQYLNAATQGFNQSGRDIRDTGQRMSDDTTSMAGRISADYGGALDALRSMPGQLQSGMQQLGNSTQDFVNALLRRASPTAMESYQDQRMLGQMMAADRAADMGRSSSAYPNMLRDRLAMSRIPLARPGMMTGNMRAR